MLSALQRRLAALVTEIPEAQDFVIAGGAALILQGQAQRVTTDLDYFARSPHAVDDLLPVVEARFSADGLSVERRQVTSGFARLAVSDGAENCQWIWATTSAYAIRRSPRSALSLALKSSPRTRS